MGTETKTDTTVITLKGGRGSFLTLSEPEYYGGKKTKETDKKRWSATILLPYNDPQIKLVDALIKKVAQTKWEKKWESILENILVDPKACFKMDGKRKDYAGYEGMWAMTCHRNEEKGPPIVMDSDKSPIYEKVKRDGAVTRELVEGKAGRLYSGAYINLQFQVWPQDNASGKGIRAEFLAIQRVKDGDAFAGGAAADVDAFEEITEGADADDLG